MQMDTKNLKGMVGNLDIIISYNEQLHQMFLALYKEYSEINKIHFVEDDANLIYYDFDKRCSFLLNEVLSMFDCYEDSNLIEELKYKVEKFFQADYSLSKLKIIMEREFRKFEIVIDNFLNDNINVNDITMFFYSIRYAYENFVEKKFNKEFSFYSKSIEKSFFKDINISLGINNHQIWHMFELPGFFKVLKDAYDSEIPNNMSIEEFIYSEESKKILRLYLLEENNKLTEKEKKILEYFESKYGKNSQTKKEKKNNLKKEIAYIITKSINFSKVYEYKNIPEIILGYDCPEKNHDPLSNSNQINKNYNYSSYSSAFTKIKCENLLSDLEYQNLNEINKSIYEKISSEIGKENVYIRYNKNGIIDKIYDSNNHIQYTIYKEQDKILLKSDLQPNLFIVSYDKETIEKNDFICKLNLFLAVYYTIINICKDLKIDYCELKKKFPQSNEKINLRSSKDLYDIANKLLDPKTKHYFNSDILSLIISNINENDYENDYSIYKEYIKKENYKTLADIILTLVNSNKITDNLRKKVSGYLPFGTKIPEMGIFIPLMQKINEEDKIDIYKEKNIGTIGYGIRFKKNDDDKLTDDDIIDKYPKTFMAKNISQLIGDLRINGNSFMLDTIYDSSSKNVYNTKFITENNSKIIKLIREKINEKVNSTGKKL